MWREQNGERFVFDLATALISSAELIRVSLFIVFFLPKM